eukprot:gene12974-7632_t
MINPFSQDKVDEVNEEIPSFSYPQNSIKGYSQIYPHPQQNNSQPSYEELIHQLNEKDKYIQYLQTHIQEQDAYIQQLQLHAQTVQLSNVTISTTETKEEKIKTVQVYRYYTKSPHWKYFYSLTPEGQPKGFQAEKGKFEYFKSPDPSHQGVFGVYVLKSLKKESQGFCYRQKPNPNSKEWKPIEICCYLYQNRMKNTIPIYLKSHDNPYRECLSISEPEKSGWKNIKVMGYAYDNLTIF